MDPVADVALVLGEVEVEGDRLVGDGQLNGGFGAHHSTVVDERWRLLQRPDPGKSRICESCPCSCSSPCSLPPPPPPRPLPARRATKALWTEADKDGFGTAHGTRSKVWHTLDDGELTEVYYPDIDTPALRDLQFVVSDGKTFAERERETRATRSRSPTSAR